MKLKYPVNYPEHITQHFGERQEYYSQFSIGGVKLKGHNGIDLRAPMGCKIFACADGFAQEVLDQGKVGYGKYVKLVHDFGETLYAHLQEFKIKQGSDVKTGQVIGLANSSGNSTGSHLHFGLRINPYKRDDGWGGYSDPEPYLFGNTSTELDMPKWAKNLQPFFIENNLKDDQIEPSVREAFGDRKILAGFIEKWAEKFQVDKDLGVIEAEIQKLLDLEDEHIDLVSSLEAIVGHFETEKGLRDATRALRTDLDEVSKVNKMLVEENKILKKKRTLDKYGVKELLSEIFNKLVSKIWGVIKNAKQKMDIK